MGKFQLSTFDFRTPPPEKPGLYLFSCAETNDSTETLEVVDSPIGLVVLCPDLGPTPLKDYHAGLTYPKWQKQ